MNFSKSAWVVRVILFLVSAMGMLTACSLGELSLPTEIPIPIINLDSNSDATPKPVTTRDESPRQGIEINLPPTWTPILNLGQETPVPAPDKPTGADPNLRRYTVQAGDTLAGIAIQFDVSLETLAQINNITDQDHIEVGQELLIPGR